MFLVKEIYTGADPGILKTGGGKISLALNPAPHHGWGVKKMVGGGSVLRKRGGGGGGGARCGRPPLDPPLLYTEFTEM